MRAHSGAYLPHPGGVWTGGTLGQPGALEGDPNRSAEFTGSSGYAQVADDAAFNFGTAMSAVAWVKAAAQDNRAIASHYDYGADQRSWRMGSGTGSDTAKLRVILSSNGEYVAGTRKDYVSSVDVFDGAWHLVAFTFDNDELKLYIDGVEDTGVTKTYDDTVNSLHDSTAAVGVGRNFDGGSPIGWFDGLIDEAPAPPAAGSVMPCGDGATYSAASGEAVEHSRAGQERPGRDSR